MRAPASKYIYSKPGTLRNAAIEINESLRFKTQYIKDTKMSVRKL